jgi:exodeoxyribonuclease V gamma subunit
MREAQVLKDLLLAEFEKNPDLAPHDIIVMMPDIEA